MKRLTSLVLALLLALTMMVGAFAETADVTGEWYGELLGIQVTLTINADGTYKMDIAGMDSEEGVWEKNEDGNVFRPCTFLGGNCYTFDAVVARKHE